MTSCYLMDTDKPMRHRSGGWGGRNARPLEHWRVANPCPRLRRGNGYPPDPRAKRGGGGANGSFWKLYRGRRVELFP